MRLVVPLLTVVAILAGCSGADAARSSTAGEPLLVVTTVSPLTSIASQVAGPHAKVVGIVPEGTNSHTFEPPPSAAGALSRADLILVNGLHLEQPTVELAEANKRTATPVVALGDATIAPEDYLYDFSFPRSGGKPNPHAWTDPTLAVGYASVIAQELTKLDPAHASDFEANLAEFTAAAERLELALRADSATVPGGIRLLTYHDSFAYVAERHGWQVIGAIQPADFEDPTAAEVARIIDQVEKQDVPAIFGSEVFPSPVLAEIANETGAAYIDDLRDDDLPGGPGDPEHSWQGLMRFDFSTIVTGLGGRATGLDALDLTTGPDSAEYPQ